MYDKFSEEILDEMMPQCRNQKQNKKRNKRKEDHVYKIEETGDFEMFFRDHH